MLKSNIDLTANEMFSRREFPSMPLWKLLHEKFPWSNKGINIVKSDTDLSGLRFEGISTGNKEQRDLKKT